ncbi:Cyclin, N-terminal domain containing protein [Tritrichomonas foetus]|uniref:Cyclin, N-terminal domain containing protein n=1 Tax=Tritrichomonas foetus TaxID=1144522 RepID=A0A1J4K765_9EUKA|nr:Cyclin, N-terminal domain containing protein [Tritrichomonas foetus]|eukprot:OHT07035.1 Cyclin, N-terminal domain containing protein [Tritrichomonas foetus]
MWPLRTIISNQLYVKPELQKRPISMMRPHFMTSKKHGNLHIAPFKHLEIKLGNPDDIYDVSEYENIIYRSLRNEDNRLKNFWFNQEKITIRHRNILIDRFCEHHFNAQLMTTTFYRFIGIFDRFLSTTHVDVNDFEIYAFASLFIASKLEEMQPLSTNDLLMMSGNLFLPEALYMAEEKVANSIKFDFMFPLPIEYLNNFIRVSGQDINSHFTSRYILEVIQTHEAFYGMKGSLMAAVAILVTRYLMNEEQKWTKELEGYTGYAKMDLIHFARVIHSALLEDERLEINIIKQKYVSELYHKVANCQIPARFE